VQGVRSPVFGAGGADLLDCVRRFGGQLSQETQSKRYRAQTLLAAASAPRAVCCLLRGIRPKRASTPEGKRAAHSKKQAFVLAHRMACGVVCMHIYRCAHARMPCVPSRLFFAAKLGGAISCRPLNSTATLSSTTQVLNVDRTMPAPSRSESQMPRGNPNYSLTASSIEFELRVSAKDTGVKIGSETVSASGDVASVSDGVCSIRNPSPCQCILAFPAA
jgi:hypothetical protein